MSSISVLSRENMRDEASLKNAMRQGIFYVEIPQGCQPLIEKANAFANSFHRDPRIKQRSFSSLSRYHDRRSAQVESYYLEKQFWEQGFFRSLKTLAETMNALAINILKNVLRVSQIPEERWSAATGGIVDNRGTHHFFYNHYRHKKDAPVGIPPHVDYGQITVLYTNKAGLQVLSSCQWTDVPPKEGYFTVFLGKSFEIFLNDKAKVRAAVHRVQRVVEERTSWGITMDNCFDSPVYQYNGDTGELVTVYKKTEDYIKQSFKETY